MVPCYPLCRESEFLEHRCCWMNTEGEKNHCEQEWKQHPRRKQQPAPQAAAVGTKALGGWNFKLNHIKRKQLQPKSATTGIMVSISARSGLLRCSIAQKPGLKHKEHMQTTKLLDFRTAPCQLSLNFCQKMILFLIM